MLGGVGAVEHDAHMTHVNGSAWRSAHAFLNAFAQRRRRPSDPKRAALDRDAHDHFCAWLEAHAPLRFCAECEEFVRLAQQLDQSAAARFLDGRDLLALLPEYADRLAEEQQSTDEWDARLRYSLRLRSWLVERARLEHAPAPADMAVAVTAAVRRSRAGLRASAGRPAPMAR